MTFFHDETWRNMTKITAPEAASEAQGCRGTVIQVLTSDVSAVSYQILSVNDSLWWWYKYEDDHDIVSVLI